MQPRSTQKKIRSSRTAKLAAKQKRVLLAECKRLLLLVIPSDAKSVGSSVTVGRFLSGSELFEARAFVKWVPARGKHPRAFGLKAKDRGVDAALAKLMGLLEKAPRQR
ncbi:MAG: hypothetical protein JNM17_28600 [Archangium sp.]|nr:hypothetical protein [Archangium sp.]